MPAAIEVADLNKTFNRSVRALKDVELTIRPGEMVALIGASGSGKSTLLKHISGLHAGDRDNGKGLIRIFGDTVQEGGRISPRVRRIRARVGMIFQQFNLVSRMGLLTNVLTGTLGRIPTWRGYLGLFTTEEKVAALEALNRVGIARCAGQRASTLSGGQQQRAAIARCLVQRAEVILADEPIASLDPESSRRVMESLARVNRQGITVVVCLHQVEYATRYCPRTIAMRDGEVVFDGASEQLTPGFLREIYGADSEELILGLQAARARHEDEVSDPEFALASG